MLSFFASIPRVEALRTSTLGYEIATPTELPRVRTIHNEPLISLSIPWSINEWRTTTTAIPPTAPLHLIIYIGRTYLPTPGHKRAPGRVRAVPSTSSCFFTGDSRTFFTAAGRFLNRGGCCRHAAHDGGKCWDGPQRQLLHPRTQTSHPPWRNTRKQRQLCRSCDSPAQGCGRSTLPWVRAPTNLATL